jgi:3-hydroxyisobutyrate dehydrogenase-like beta-hydroxyacid dehydrogenase
VAAPVFGRPEAAAAAKLFIVAAGEPATIEACQPLFSAIGQKTIPIGTEPAAANLVKLSGNFLLASAIEALGEAIALVGKAGIDRSAYVDLLTSTVFNVPAYKTYGNLIAQSQFEPAAFAAPLGYKDIRLALAAAESLRVPMPLASLLHDRFLRLFAQGGEKLDWSAIGGLATQDAGDNQTATASLMPSAV